MIPGPDTVPACLPYLTASILVLGLAWRLRRWNRARAASSPLFPLSPRTRQSAPSPALDAARIAAEICLLRGRRAGKPAHAAWCFHFSLVLLLIGHIRAFTDFPRLWAALGLSPEVVATLAALAGGAAGLFALGSGLWLAGRRLVLPGLRGITRFEDVFLLALLLAVIASGLAMRLGRATDLESVRSYFAALASLRPGPMPETPGFALHFLLAQALIVVFPFGKLLHAAGILPAKLGLGRGAVRAVSPPA